MPRFAAAHRLGRRFRRPRYQRGQEQSGQRDSDAGEGVQRNRRLDADPVAQPAHQQHSGRRSDSDAQALQTDHPAAHLRRRRPHGDRALHGPETGKAKPAQNEDREGCRVPRGPHENSGRNHHAERAGRENPTVIPNRSHRCQDYRRHQLPDRFRGRQHTDQRLAHPQVIPADGGHELSGREGSPLIIIVMKSIPISCRWLKAARTTSPRLFQIGSTRHSRSTRGIRTRNASETAAMCITDMAA